MRYEHWLPTARPSAWPGAVVCVSCDVRWTAGANTGGREYATLHSWSVALAVGRAGEYSVARRAVGTDADSFWAALTTASLRGKNVWVLSHDFRAAAAALGLWDRMESGHVRIAGRDQRSAHRGGKMRAVRPTDGRDNSQPEIVDDRISGASPVSGPLAQDSGVKRYGTGKRKRALSGVCILEDPPIVLELLLDCGGSKITWVDVANYGVDFSATIAAGSARSTALADWFCRAASTLHSLGPCGWQSTAGSQSMHLFRSVFHGTPTLCHTERRATALERFGLYGGRCEPFRLGRIDGNCHMYDFRSLYAYLYSTEMVPIRLAAVYGPSEIPEISFADPSQWLIAKVDIETEEPEYPYRDIHAVIYPVGRFTTVLCGPELRRAIAASHVIRVRSAARYEADSALAGYAKALYGIRQRADAGENQPLAQWAKRIMNCLHGKFAQVDRKWLECPNAECAWEWGEWHHRLASGEFQRRRVVAGAITKEVIGGFSHGTVPAIACAIASAGRDRLLAAIHAAGWEHVHYCDTDAIIVDDYGAESLTLADWIRPGEWGYLQHVETAAECTIHGVKRYSIGGRVREAGRALDNRQGESDARGSYLQAGIRESLSVKMIPANWRESHPWTPGPGRYDRHRLPGGCVMPIEKDKWDDE